MYIISNINHLLKEICCWQKLNFIYYWLEQLINIIYLTITCMYFQVLNIKKATKGCGSSVPPPQGGGGSSAMCKNQVLNIKKATKGCDSSVPPPPQGV